MPLMDYAQQSLLLNGDGEEAHPAVGKLVVVARDGMAEGHLCCVCVERSLKPETNRDGGIYRNVGDGATPPCRMVFTTIDGILHISAAV